MNIADGHVDNFTRALPLRGLVPCFHALERHIHAQDRAKERSFLHKRPRQDAGSAGRRRRLRQRIISEKVYSEGASFRVVRDDGLDIGRSGDSTRGFGCNIRIALHRRLRASVMEWSEAEAKSGEQARVSTTPFPTGWTAAPGPPANRRSSANPSSPCPAFGGSFGSVAAAFRWIGGRRL